MPDYPRLLNYTPARPFSAIPQYYTPFPQQSPTRPGWHCCELTDGRIKHLVWHCGSFWDDDQECPDVAFWVELPEFVQALLSSDITSAAG